jgi:hypothetical protein
MDYPEKLTPELKVCLAKNCPTEEHLPELLITGAGIPTTVGTTASSLTLKDLKDSKSFIIWVF